MEKSKPPARWVPRMSKFEQVGNVKNTFGANEFFLCTPTPNSYSPSYPTEKNGAAEYKWDKESRKIKQGQDTPKQQPLTTKYPQTATTDN